MAKNNHQGQVIGLKIESDRPEDSPRFIAMQLASAITTETNARNDSKNFREQASRERQKAKQFSDILVMLTEYNSKKNKALKSGEPWVPSRMEPMESYNKNEIKKERAALIDRARDLEEQANNFDKLADESRRKYLELQKILQSMAKD